MADPRVDLEAAPINLVCMRVHPSACPDDREARFDNTAWFFPHNGVEVVSCGCRPREPPMCGRCVFRPNTLHAAAGQRRVCVELPAQDLGSKHVFPIVRPADGCNDDDEDWTSFQDSVTAELQLWKQKTIDANPLTPENVFTVLEENFSPFCTVHRMLHFCPDMQESLGLAVLMITATP